MDEFVDFLCDKYDHQGPGGAFWFASLCGTLKRNAPIVSKIAAAARQQYNSAPVPDENDSRELTTWLVENGLAVFEKGFIETLQVPRSSSNASPSERSTHTRTRDHGSVVVGRLCPYAGCRMVASYECHFTCCLYTRSTVYAIWPI